MFFFWKGEIYLELNESDTEPIGKIMISKELSPEENDLKTEHLLQDVPMHLWALSSTNIGKIKSAITIKISIDNTLPQPNIC